MLYVSGRFLFYPLQFHDKKQREKDFHLSPFALYPDPGSNRDGFPHWCLRPARLPIPPSGHLFDCECKGSTSFCYFQIKITFFREKVQFSFKIGAFSTF